MTALDALQKFPQSILNRDPDSNIGKIWKIISPQIDEVTKQLQTLKDIEDIYRATGFTLDQLGALVNETRSPGDDDPTYRLFILIAIAKRLAKGTIPEIIEIGKNIAGLETGALFVTKELFENDGSVLVLDGNSILNGFDPLNPSTVRPASFEVEIQGNVDTIQVPTLLASAVASIKGAGIYAKTRIRFLFNEVQGLLFTIRKSILDHSTIFDGLTLINPQANYNIDKIAIGDGATSPPSPLDIGLIHELIRKSPIIRNFPDGTRDYTLDILAPEVNGTNINEIAFFSSGRLIYKDVFSLKPKNETLVYDFTLKEIAI